MADVKAVEGGTRRRRRGSVQVGAMAPAPARSGGEVSGKAIPAPAQAEAAAPKRRGGEEKYDAISATVKAFGVHVGILDKDSKFVKAEVLAERVAEFFGFPDGVRVTFVYADRFQGLCIKFQPKGRQPDGKRYPELGFDLFPTDLELIGLSDGGGGVLEEKG